MNLRDKALQAYKEHQTNQEAVDKKRNSDTQASYEKILYDMFNVEVSLTPIENHFEILPGLSVVQIRTGYTTPKFRLYLTVFGQYGACRYEFNDLASFGAGIEKCEAYLEEHKQELEDKPTRFNELTMADANKEQRPFHVLGVVIFEDSTYIVVEYEDIK